jgi:serine protease inhibitor
MKTQVKTLFVDKPEQVEMTLNNWLTDNEDVEIHQILPYQIIKNEKPTLMILVFYCKEGWR